MFLTTARSIAPTTMFLAASQDTSFVLRGLTELLLANSLVVDGSNVCVTMGPGQIGSLLSGRFDATTVATFMAQLRAGELHGQRARPATIKSAGPLFDQETSNQLQRAMKKKGSNRFKVAVAANAILKREGSKGNITESTVQRLLQGELSRSVAKIKAVCEALGFDRDSTAFLLARERKGNLIIKKIRAVAQSGHLLELLKFSLHQYLFGQPQYTEDTATGLQQAMETKDLSPHVVAERASEILDIDTDSVTPTMVYRWRDHTSIPASNPKAQAIAQAVGLCWEEISPLVEWERLLQNLRSKCPLEEAIEAIVQVLLHEYIFRTPSRDKLQSLNQLEARIMEGLKATKGANEITDAPFIDPNEQRESIDAFLAALDRELKELEMSSRTPDQSRGHA